MSFKQTLFRILLLLRGDTPIAPPFVITDTTPRSDDPKELLALKWEKKITG